MVITISGHDVILWRDPITDNDIVWGSDKISDTEIQRISGIADIRDRSELEFYRSDKKETGEDTTRSLIHRLRLIKTPDEIDKIRQAIRVSQEAHAFIESMLRA